MDRVNQRENHLLGENIKRLRIEHNLRNCDVLAQLQLRGVDIARSTYSKIESIRGIFFIGSHDIMCKTNLKSQN